MGLDLNLVEPQTGFSSLESDMSGSVPLLLEPIKVTAGLLVPPGEIADRRRSQLEDVHLDNFVEVCRIRFWALRLGLGLSLGLFSFSWSFRLLLSACFFLFLFFLFLLFFFYYHCWGGWAPAAPSSEPAAEPALGSSSSSSSSSEELLTRYTSTYCACCPFASTRSRLRTHQAHALPWKHNIELRSSILLEPKVTSGYIKPLDLYTAHEGYIWSIHVFIS